jgi:ubiquitin carboxyl-terminal hydrolase 34
MVLLAGQAPVAAHVPEQAAVVSPPPLSPALSMRPHMPRLIYDSTWSENTNFLFDRNIFDEQYFVFAARLVQLELSAPPAGPYSLCRSNPFVCVCVLTRRISTDPAVALAADDPSLLATQLAVRFVLETLVHAKEKASLPQWLELVGSRLRASQSASAWFLGYAARPECSWVKQLLLACPLPEIRAAFGQLAMDALRTLHPVEASRYLDLLPASDTEMPVRHASL